MSSPVAALVVSVALVSANGAAGQAESEFFKIDEETLRAVRDAAVAAYPDLSSSPGVWTHFAERRDSETVVTIVFEPHEVIQGRSRVGLIRCRDQGHWACEENGHWIVLAVSSQDEPVILKGHELSTTDAEAVVRRTLAAIINTCGDVGFRVRTMRRHDDQLIVRYGTGPYFSVRSHGSVSFEYRNSTEGGHFELSGPVRSCPVGP